MVIQHNMAAIGANRYLSINTKNRAKSMEKLSSGYYINRAADNAAGLSISEKMRSQIRELTRASENAQDGISMVQTAEGALNEVIDMLQRMNELAVKAANETNSEDDRSMIQDEVSQLISEIDRISDTTHFNEIPLLKGEPGNKVAINGAGHVGGSSLYTVRANQDLFIFPNGQDKNGIKIESGTYVDEKYMDSATGDFKSDYDVYVKADDQTLGSFPWGWGNCIYFGPGANVINESNPSEIYKFTGGVLPLGHGNIASGKMRIIDVNGQPVMTPQEGYIIITNATSSAFTKQQRTDLKNETKTVNIFVGAGNSIRVRLEDMHSNALGISDLSVSGNDGTNAQNSIDKINSAMERVSSYRSYLGAMQNRLEHTIKNLDNAAENTTAAESRIRDTNMATEMVKLAKNNILLQVGQSMLTQANQSKQGVLSLLG